VVSGTYFTLPSCVRYPVKAPLPYWLVAFSFTGFGSERVLTTAMVLCNNAAGLAGGFRGDACASGERAGEIDGFVRVYSWRLEACYLLHSHVLFREVLLQACLLQVTVLFPTAEPEATAWRGTCKDTS